MEPQTHTIRDFLHTMPAVLYEYVLHNNGDGELLFLSPTSKEILGHPPAYFVEDMDRFWEMVHQEDLERLKQEDHAAKLGNTFFESEIRIHHPAGVEIWVRLSSKPTEKMKQGSFIWSGYIIEISQQERRLDPKHHDSNMLSMCAWCKNIKKTEEEWVSLEDYLLENTKKHLTHGLCPRCCEKVFQDLGLHS